MLAHILSALVLAVYAFEVYRTVQRFGVRRSGMIGGVAGNPGAHVVVAVLMTLVAFLLAVSFAAVPLWVAPVAAVINLVYLVLALRYAGRRRQEREARRQGR